MNGCYDEKIQLIRKKCQEVKENAYCPYSKFRVGCAVLTDKGNVYVGCNVENCSYGLTLCAETVAVGNAVAAGDRNIVAMAVSTDLPPSSPKSMCGRCRQFTAEFGDEDMDIIYEHGDGNCTTVKLGEILPNAFTPKSLLVGQKNAVAMNHVNGAVNSA